MSSWLADARVDAIETVMEFTETIVEDYIDHGEVSDDLLNDYPGGDSYHHETHVDKSYDLSEAAELLEELDAYEETDEGLWQGQKPREAISTQAAFTYGNAVMSIFRDLIKEINDNTELQEIKSSYDEVADEVAEELEEAETDFNEKQNELEDAHDTLQQTLPESERKPYQRPEFVPPFDEDEEIDKREDEIRGELESCIETIIEGF